MTNINQFNAKLNLFAGTLTNQQIDNFVRKVVFELMGRMVRKTPVDTGRAKGNWQVDQGKIPNTILEKFDKNGLRTIGDNTARVVTFNSRQKMYIINNLEYIVYLENGTPHIVPRKMRENAIREVEQIFR